MCTQFLLLCEHTECNKHCDSFHDSNNINIIVDDGGGGGGVDDDKSSTFLPEQIARIRSASVEKPLWNGWKKNHKDGERKKKDTKQPSTQVQKCLMRKCYLYAKCSFFLTLSTAPCLSFSEERVCLCVLDACTHALRFHSLVQITNQIKSTTNRHRKYTRNANILIRWCWIFVVQSFI